MNFKVFGSVMLVCCLAGFLGGYGYFRSSESGYFQQVFAPDENKAAADAAMLALETGYVMGRTEMDAIDVARRERASTGRTLMLVFGFGAVLGFAVTVASPSSRPPIAASKESEQR